MTAGGPAGAKGGGPAPVVAIIPARLGSTRLPEKVLLRDTGRPLIAHVYEAASRCRGVSAVCVATDSLRVSAAVEALGGRAILTSPDHPNGTSRLAEAARLLGLPPGAVIVNVQGDEPELEPALVEAALQAHARTGAEAGTAAVPFAEDENPGDPNMVKVVTRGDNTALYFSRSRIPFPRDPAGSAPLKHVGVYVYTRAFLEDYVMTPPTPLERVESLEQLRILESGWRIAVGVVPVRTFGGIDTAEQYAAFVERFRRRGG